MCPKASLLRLGQRQVLKWLADKLEDMAKKISSWPLWALADVVLIILFAFIGRRSHEEGLAIGHVLYTALPFIIGYVIALAISRPWQSINNLWPAGIIVWLGTVVLGLAVRIMMGSTAAVSFMIVTAVVLGFFLLARRLLGKLALRRSQQNQA